MTASKSEIAAGKKHFDRETGAKRVYMHHLAINDQVCLICFSWSGAEFAALHLKKKIISGSVKVKNVKFDYRV